MPKTARKKTAIQVIWGWRAGENNLHVVSIRNAIPHTTRLSWHRQGKTRLTPEERQRSPGLGQKRGIRRPESVFLHLHASSCAQFMAPKIGQKPQRQFHATICVCVCVSAHPKIEPIFLCMCEQWHQFLLNLKCVGYSCSHEYMAIAVVFSIAARTIEWHT